MKQRIVTAGHLMLNAVDALLIRMLLGPINTKKMHISFDDVHESLVEIIEISMVPYLIILFSVV